MKNQIAWARFYCVKAGYLDASQRGVWALTEAGRAAKVDPDSVLSLFKDVHKQWSTNDRSTEAITDEEAELPQEETGDYRTHLLAILRKLPSSGFERICQRLLRENGFQQVSVTGRSATAESMGMECLRSIRSSRSRCSLSANAKVTAPPSRLARFAIFAAQCRDVLTRA